MAKKSGVAFRLLNMLIFWTILLYENVGRQTLIIPSSPVFPWLGNTASICPSLHSSACSTSSHRLIPILPPRNGLLYFTAKQPGGRKPPVPWVPWTPHIPGRNSSTDPTPQQMPRPDPPTPLRLTRRRSSAALQRLIAHGQQLIMLIGKRKCWATSEFSLEYKHFVKGIQGLESKMYQNVESWQGSRLLI